MKTTKLLGFFAILFGCAAALAFTPAPTAPKAEGDSFSVYYRLSSGGNKLTRTDWVASTPDDNCEEVFSSMPCRIFATPDGPNPSAASFSNILSGSANFTQSYSDVTYIQPD